MAYLAEEMDRSALGLAMGLFIAGSTLGGMGGRLSVAAIADLGGWRVGVGAIGAFSLGLLGPVSRWPCRPSARASRRDCAHPIRPAIRLHLERPGPALPVSLLGFLVMGAFVTTYNYIGFRLAAAPFSLSQASIGFVFVIYLVGAIVSPAAGELAGRYGRRRIIGPAIILMPLGVLATLPNNLPLTILGVALVTAGFFGGHSIASSWVGLRAEKAQAQASALYLFFYYLGSSVAGTLGGLALSRARMARRRRIRRRACGAGARRRAAAVERAAAGASADLRAAHGMARRGPRHRRPPARRAFGDRRGDDPLARPAFRARARRTLVAADALRCSPAIRSASSGAPGSTSISAPSRSSL